jgi:DNA-binding XRE family transcriptional regulator
MARRPASITQADVARAIRAAKQTGATEVEVPLEKSSEIVL